MSTLSQLRDRVLTQIQAASGWIEPLVVTASDIQLATGTPNLRVRVQLLLQDTNVRWSSDDVDEAIRLALEEYSDKQPYHAIATVTVTSASREVDISGIPGVLRVEKVWWDYDSGSPGYPPNWRQFEVWPGGILYIDDDDTPEPNDVMRIWYTSMHTVNGLDGATSTTVPVDDVPAIIHLAAAFAAQARAVELAETLTVDDDVVSRLTAWAEDQRKHARYAMREDLPAWQRRASAFNQSDVDEAIRWALGRINEVAPNLKNTTITLPSAGREVSISAITDYLDIVKVWFPYNATDPTYPPNWCDFELWPGDVLFLQTSAEPQPGEVARVFYTTLHTINGLDSQTTTLSPAHEELIIVGASGFATQERGLEEEGYYTNTRLRFWSEARLAEFEAALHRLARRNAAKASGIAPSHSLDRWDQEWAWW